MQRDQVACRYVGLGLVKVGHGLGVVEDGESLQGAFGVAPVQLRVL